MNGRQNRYAFSARQRYFVSPAPLFSPFFSGKTEKNGPPEAQRAIPAQKRYGLRSGGCGFANRTAPPAQQKEIPHIRADKRGRRRKMKKFFGEFKEFISRGNVMDMAIGVIIATAFGKITTSLVGDVFMPLIGWLIGDIDLTQLNITLSPAVLNEAGEVTKEAVVIGIGTFLTTIIDFLLVALIVFSIVKAFNTAKKKLEKPAEPEPAKDPEPTKEELLLTEIRDLLKNK